MYGKYVLMNHRPGVRDKHRYPPVGEAEGKMIEWLERGESNQSNRSKQE